MGSPKLPNQLVCITLLSILVIQIQCAVRDLTTQPDDSRPTLYRKARDDRYYLNRYGSNQPNSGSGALASADRRNVKPETSPEARDTDASRDPAVEKRCIRCATSGYADPYDYRDYDRTDRYYDRYDDRRASYDDRYDYRAAPPYDRYDTRYDSRYENRYDRTPYERDRWYERRPEYDRASYDRFDSRGGAGGAVGGYGGGYGGGDRYDNRGGAGGSAAYDYRGFGYDNRGYDNRGQHDYRKAPYDSRGFRPWDETTRGSSGWDNYGRGYYFASGRPEPTAAGGAGSYGYDRAYASGYNYGGAGAGAGAGAGRGGDSWRDPYASRPRDPYAYDGYRGTSYLYERNPPSPKTSSRPPPPAKDGDAGSATDRPDTNPNKSSDNAGSG